MKLNIKVPAKAVVVAPPRDSTIAPPTIQNKIRPIVSSPLRPPLLMVDDPIMPKFVWYIRTRIANIKKSSVQYKIIATTEEKALVKLQRRLSMRHIYLMRSNKLITRIKKGKEIKPDAA